MFNTFINHLDDRTVNSLSKFAVDTKLEGVVDPQMVVMQFRGASKGWRWAGQNLFKFKGSAKSHTVNNSTYQYKLVDNWLENKLAKDWWPATCSQGKEGQQHPGIH